MNTKTQKTYMAPAVTVVELKICSVLASSPVKETDGVVDYGGKTTEDGINAQTNSVIRQPNAWQEW